MAKRLLNGIGYIPLIIAAIAACWFHYAVFPNVIRGASAIDPAVALPEGIHLIVKLGPYLVSVPILFCFLAVASAWFDSLGKAWVIGTLGALFALFLLFYAYLLSTPLLMYASWSSK
jgi:hypothetical protein